MNSKYDDEIREAEQRLIRDRQALVDEAHALTIRAREAAASPKGLFAAFVIGYVVGELTAPKRRDKRREAAVATTKKVGIGGLLGSAVLAYVRSQYGSPWVLGRRWRSLRRRLEVAGAGHVVAADLAATTLVWHLARRYPTIVATTALDRPAEPLRRDQ